jgi:hypothetical protein
MNRVIVFLLVLIFCSCDKEDVHLQEKINVTVKFTHYWDGTLITAQDFNDFKFTTANGELVSVDRLRYVLSKIKLINGDDVYTFKNYKLIDLEEENDFVLNLSKAINQGSYQLNFTFGFSDEDNQDGVYQDLNSVSFNVPSMLGGGYHYMQLDGKYKDVNNQDASFNYHTIRAVDRIDPNNLVFQDTSFEVDFGTLSFINDAEIIIKVNIAEWFKNPNIWNLNELNTVLMPNFEAQKQMSANGKTVFTLGDIN